MHLKIFIAPNATVGKSRNPNVSRPTQFSLRPKRKPALNELRCLFETHFWRNQYMKMIRHDYELMKQKLLGSISEKHIDKESRPSLVPKERLAPSSIGGNEVGLSVRRRHLSIWPHITPSGAKAPICSTPLRRG
jgi:hypothetical protein